MLWWHLFFFFLGCFPFIVTIWFELEDYVLDPNALWLALRGDHFINFVFLTNITTSCKSTHMSYTDVVTWGYNIYQNPLDCLPVLLLPTGTTVSLSPISSSYSSA
jgi:hypothetical protein